MRGMNAPLRKLSSVHRTHRDQVLSAIGDKHHKLNARIDHSRGSAMKFRDSLHTFTASMPEDVGSRLDWMQKQLNAKNI
jgi:hypothetical protein